MAELYIKWCEHCEAVTEAYLDEWTGLLACVQCGFQGNYLREPTDEELDTYDPDAWINDITDYPVPGTHSS